MYRCVFLYKAGIGLLKLEQHKLLAMDFDQCMIAITRTREMQWYPITTTCVCSIAITRTRDLKIWASLLGLCCWSLPSSHNYTSHTAVPQTQSASRTTALSNSPMRSVLQGTHLSRWIALAPSKSRAVVSKPSTNCWAHEATYHHISWTAALQQLHLVWRFCSILAQFWLHHLLERCWICKAKFHLQVNNEH